MTMDTPVIIDISVISWPGVQVVKGKNRGGIDIKPAHVPIAGRFGNRFGISGPGIQPPVEPHNER